MKTRFLLVGFLLSSMLLGCSSNETKEPEEVKQTDRKEVKIERTEVEIASEEIAAEPIEPQPQQPVIETETPIVDQTTTETSTNVKEEPKVTTTSKKHEPENVVLVKPNISTVEKLLPLDHSEARTTDTTHIMIHFISNAAANPRDPYNVNDVYSIFEDYGLSVHYMIDRSGQIYQLVSENRVAYHAGKGSLPNLPRYENKMNDYSIGIELLAIGTKEEMTAIMPENTYNQIDSSIAGYTDAQYQSLQVLITDIVKRNPLIHSNRQHIIGHDEYAPGRKTDPGSLFDWSRIGF
ncbi:N-acetylmuramoyl-L-alanine amidase [Ferdinandcohnia sp. Marseille-Q9671]